MDLAHLPLPDPAVSCVCIDARGNRFVDTVTERAVLTMLIEDDEVDRAYVELAIARGCPVVRDGSEREAWEAKVRRERGW